MVLQFVEKGFYFSENSFQSQNFENLQNFQWLSHKNKPISQTESYFEIPKYRFLENHVLSAGFKIKPLRKCVSCVKIKTNLNFAVIVDEPPFLNICTL